jgi:hypothetical protein
MIPKSHLDVIDKIRILRRKSNPVSLVEQAIAQSLYRLSSRSSFICLRYKYNLISGNIKIMLMERILCGLYFIFLTSEFSNSKQL